MPVAAVAAVLLSLLLVPDTLEERLAARLGEEVAGGRAPGVTAAVAFADGRCVEVAWGTTERGGGRPLVAGDRMLGGSTGKTFVAALALQLAAEEKVDLDAPLAATFGGQPWFDALPNAATLTPRHLLGHRSGLQRYEFDPRFLEQLAAEPDRAFTPREELAFLAGQEAPFAAGEGNGFLPQDLMLEDGRMVVNPVFEGAGGGYVSSSGDLARWALALWGGERVVDGEQRAAMLDAAPAPELGADVRYGCGVIVRDSPLGRSLGHSGFFPGWITDVRCWPEQGLAVALQANSSERGALPRAAGAVLMALAEEALADC